MNMSSLIHDRGRGPEIIGTRITVYNLLPHFLDANSTEEQLCAWYELSPEQVAAARAYVLNHFEHVMAEHRRIEERLNAENSPTVLEQTRAVRDKLKRFKEWLDQKEAASHTPNNGATGGSFPTFQEWLTAKGTHAGEK
jgi:uncharacterized protein (DUF433 family)